jgi:hypothetical protein
MRRQQTQKFDAGVSGAPDYAYLDHDFPELTLYDSEF